jgi:cyclophilin family peptidyl-prolyl cis-trans isomerase
MVAAAVTSLACQKHVGQQGNSAAVPQGGGHPVVVMETSLGTIKIELDADKAPKTVANFLRYADEGFYDGTIIHRVTTMPTAGIAVIQGGGFTPDMKQKAPHQPIVNEADNGLSNVRGTICMARSGNPDSATSQFFINVQDNTALDHKGPGPEFGYAVFGKVIDGMDVVDKIQNVRTGTVTPPGTPFPMADVPVEAVVIKSVKRQ